MAPAYFERTRSSTFRPSDHVGGAWDIDTQHISPALGLLVHEVERDRDARRDDAMVVGRLSFDILGTVPMSDVDVRVSVLRPGRTIELVEAVLEYDARPIVRLRVWLMQPRPTADLADTPIRRIDPPTAMAPWDASTLWEGGFIASAEVRRTQTEPGKASYWVRSAMSLVADEDVSDVANFARLLDIANGMTVRADPRQLSFPNIDLTAHLFTEPRGEWVGFDTEVSFGASGIGLTHSTIHDIDGPVGVLSQMLTLRPS